MDRYELEGLIAQTMQRPPPPPNASLSPTQQFQSPVRGLAGRPRHAQAQSESAAVSLSRRDEVHHISTLRVQHSRNASAVPARGRTALSETSRNLQRTQIVACTDSAVPDFSAEEREAWGKKSPLTTSASIRPRHGQEVSSPSRPAALKPRQLLLFPPPERLEPLPQPRKQARQSSLREFKPLPTAADHERPKTSRGLPPQYPEQAQSCTKQSEQEAEAEPKTHIYASSRAGRRSKFLEGSMNDRSVATASSWYHDNTSSSEAVGDSQASSAHDIDTDSDATPRASKPLPPTPAPPATKKGMFKFGGGRSSDEIAVATEEAPKNARERKGLRKSISIWNFREKIFGGSGLDAASETSTDTITDKRGTARKDKIAGAAADIEIMNERKRKAEEAYAQQFGVKKQKSNIGQSVVSTPAKKVVVDDKRPKTPTLFRRKRDQHTSGDHKRAAEALDVHKRPSRRDLEKENQQLKTLLRESRSMTFSRSASVSSINLATTTQESLTRVPVVMLSPAKIPGRRAEDIPPVPKLPDRGVLAELQNRNRPLRPGMEMDKENHGSFATIEEGEEDVETETSEGNVTIPGNWEWPEDVF